jgi:hypothetical protein
MSSIENNSDTASNFDSRAEGSAYKNTAATENTSLSGVDRDGFPPAADKTQPWKALGVPEPEEEAWQPAPWNLLGRAWKTVLVTVDMILDLGTINTW